jgi:ATP-binding cassette subfamily B protein RaxB
MAVMDDLNFGRTRRLPIIRSAEVAECGLACLAMIAGWHGMAVTLNGLRQLFPPSLAGLSLRGLVEHADRMGFASRAARVEVEDLRHLPLPIIIHWNRSHFVVLKSIGARRAKIHDPAAGVREISLAELSGSFTGVVLELEPSSGFRPVRIGRPLRLSDLASSIRGLRSALFTVLGLSLGLQVLAFGAPLQVQFVIDDVLSRGDTSIIPVMAAAFAVLVCLQAAVEGLRAWAIQATAYTALFQVVSNIVRHLSRLPLSWFEARGVGDIMSRIGSAATIQDTLTRGVVTALLDGAMSLIAGILLFVYSPVLGGVVVAGVAVSLAMTQLAYGSLQQRMQERIAASASEQTHLMETVRAAATIKTMGREAERVADWRAHYAAAMNALASIAKYHAGINASQTLINGLQVVVVLALGASMVIDGRLSAGMLVAFLAFRQIFSDRTTTFINQLVEFRLLGLHLDRLGDIVQAETETPPASTVAAFEVTGALTLTDLEFRYGAADRDVLKGVSLVVAPGDFIAISGASGGGKTTLLKIMVGLLTPTGGEIDIDAAPASPERWRHWRTRLGFVSQDDRLLAGTVAENVAFFDPELDMARVREVIGLVGLRADVERMPMQYLTMVGDMGSTLSSGQKQRLFLARALYGDPRILILDEGTANLDETSETLITTLVKSMSITRIVVAHRPAMIHAANRRFIVRDGRLTPLEGPPEQLEPAMRDVTDRSAA